VAWYFGLTWFSAYVRKGNAPIDAANSVSLVVMKGQNWLVGLVPKTRLIIGEKGRRGKS